MAQVYVLSEDDVDDQIYVYLLEVLLSTRVELLPYRIRRGGGVGQVRKKLPLLLSAIRRAGPIDDTFFLVALDNDRGPTHDAHLNSTPRADGCRHCALDDAIAAGMPDGRPVEGAVAVPVEMIESWLLLMHAPDRYERESALPRCAWQDQEVARRVHGPEPPLQLKDLVEAERRAGGSKSKAEFILDCVLRLDVDDLAERSPSFAHFRAQVARWRGVAL